MVVPFPSFPRRSKFQNYTAVTLGLEGKEGDKVSARLWDAVDGQLKKEVGPGVDCLLTRVQSRCVFASVLICGRVCTSERTLARALLLLAWESFGATAFVLS